ncbi:hypothetical protein XELAEV_18030533mg [Xenopus laevis]|uniref:Uncharacterized protein n=1 Tax=Xenopus laevis TaxID=8355 RepID=A0A974CKZ9_XENLA|nr:hypothetical protein XELAEV_18030533mg [Xenopus laevis]
MNLNERAVPILGIYGTRSPKHGAGTDLAVLNEPDDVFEAVVTEEYRLQYRPKSELPVQRIQMARQTVLSIAMAFTQYLITGSEWADGTSGKKPGGPQTSWASTGPDLLPPKENILCRCITVFAQGAGQIPKEGHKETVVRKKRVLEGQITQNRCHRAKQLDNPGAELTNRQYNHLSYHPYSHLLYHPYIHLPYHPYIHLLYHPYIHLPYHPYSHLPDHPYIYQLYHPYIHLPYHPYIHLTYHPYIHLLFHPYIHLPYHPYIHLLYHPYIHLLYLPYIHLPYHPYIHLLYHPYIHLPYHPYIHLLYLPYIHLPYHPYIHLLYHPYIHLPYHPYIHLLYHPYIHLPYHPYSHLPDQPYIHLPYHIVIITTHTRNFTHFRCYSGAGYPLTGQGPSATAIPQSWIRTHYYLPYHPKASVTTSSLILSSVSIKNPLTPACETDCCSLNCLLYKVPVGPLTTQAEHFGTKIQRKEKKQITEQRAPVMELGLFALSVTAAVQAERNAKKNVCPPGELKGYCRGKTCFLQNVSVNSATTAESCIEICFLKQEMDFFISNFKICYGARHFDISQLPSGHVTCALINFSHTLLLHCKVE